jgi:ATP-binding cassette subfamily B (MDR/TAP) protein 1
MFLMAGLHYYGGWLVHVGEATLEEFMTPLMMMMIGTFMMMGALSGVKDGPTAHKAASLFFRAVDQTPKIDVFDQGGAEPESVTGHIEVRDVHFAYPTALDVPVCKGYSLNVEAGQTVALSGPSGSGKSTIIALIERFYDPHSGVVMLDGIDIKTLNVRWLRSQLGLVSQEPVLFQGTVAENIRYGKPDATQAEIEEAARNANAHDFISSDLHMAYETDVGLRGGKLSGGQKQRVAIARALIRKPAVLLLDEATSALDNESERIVQAALDEIMAKQKRTTIVIAHRLSTIRNADKIAVLKEGQVIEEGTHDELLANPEGLYFNLVLGQG